MTQNAFENGVLIQLTLHRWGGMKKLPKALTEAALGSKWSHAHKDLIDPAELKRIKKEGNKARTWLARKSLPFPIKGALFVPVDLIAEVDEKLSIYKSKYMDLAQNLSDRFDALRTEAAEKLGLLYNELDYPVNILRYFGFDWRFVSIDTPGRLRVISPELYEREVEKFTQTMDEARRVAVTALRTEFSEMLKRITDRLTPKPDGSAKIFRNSLVENFHEFFEDFRARNIFQDEQLATLVDRANEVLSGVSSVALRDDEHLQVNIRDSVALIESQLNGGMVNRPRRALKL